MARYLALALSIFCSWAAMALVAFAENPFDGSPPANPEPAAAEDNPFAAPPGSAAPATAQDNPFAASPGDAEPAATADNPFAANPFAGRVQQVLLDDGPRRVLTPARKAPSRTSSPSRRSPSDARLEARIRAALDEPTKMEFIDTPLQDAIEWFKDYHKIEIQLDTRALEDVGVGSDTPVRGSVDGISLASALQLLLDDLDATFVIRHGTLLITTNDAAREMSDLRVYDIAELVGPQVDPCEVGEVLQRVLPATLVVQPAKRPSSAADAARVETRIVPFRNLLVIRARLQDHDEIERLLADFKAKLQAKPQNEPDAKP